MLDRVGAATSDNQTIKSSPPKGHQKRADAYSRRPRHTGRMPSFTREQVVKVRSMLGQWTVGIAQTAKELA